MICAPTRFGIQMVWRHQLFFEVGFHDFFGIGSGEGTLPVTM